MNTEDKAAPAKPSNWIGQRFLEKLAKGTRGRIFLLNFLRSTEESDEAAIFDTLVTRVDDPDLQKLVRVHRADEDRHAEIFRQAIARVGGEPSPVDPELRVIDRLNGLLGGWGEAFLAKRIGVMEMYALLQVVEERAVREWPAIVNALRLVDPESAADVDRVIADERRHVKYAKAISRRYARDADALERTLQKVRAAEEKAYAANLEAFTRIAVREDLLEVGKVEKILWRGLVALGEARIRRADPATIPHAIPA